jgi:hypothetical protein
MEKTSAKRISRRKSALTERDRSSYIQKDCFEKSRNYCAAELNTLFVLKTLFARKLRDMSFTNPTSTVGSAAVALLKVMLRCVNDGVTTIKP